MKRFTVLAMVLGMEAKSTVIANSWVEAVRDVRRRLVNRMLTVQPSQIQVISLKEEEV